MTTANGIPTYQAIAIADLAKHIQDELEIAEYMKEQPPLAGDYSQEYWQGKVVAYQALLMDLGIKTS